jgi:FG-GAP repeat/Putative metal-binding motif
VVRSGKSSITLVLLAAIALGACGRSEQDPKEEPKAALATKEQALQCHVNSQSLADLPSSQRLVGCGTRAGWSLSSGDVDGDDFSDVVIGAPAESSNRGAVCLVLGNDSLSMASIHKALGETAARAGYSVALGDVAGTGNTVDLLAGGIGYTSNKGIVYGVDGANLPNFSLSSSAKYLGAVTADETGTALAVGDVTGDGLADFITSAPLNETAPATTNSGIVYIVKNTGAPLASTNLFGGSLSILRIQNLAPLVSQTDLRAGTSLAVADLNGDGVKDLLVGIPGYTGSAGANSGAVFVFYGPLTANRALSSADLKLVGATAGELAGTSLARVGDRNGDGKDDILIGAPGSASVAGKAYLVHGGLGSGTISLASQMALNGGVGERAGTSVAAGDFNADGLPDMLVGAPGYQLDQGAVFLINGDDALSPSQSLLGFTTLVGVATGDQAGYAVASAGDFNHDGTDDILIGAPYANSGVGTAYLVSGEAPHNWYEDSDGDGFGAIAGTPVLDCVPPVGQWVTDHTDCDDANLDINPNAQELCSTVGVDDNCNGEVDEEGASDAPFWAKDSDHDKYVDVFEPLKQTCASPGPGYINNNDILGYECPEPDSDTDTNTHENALEVCDTKDNNCNGEVDDGDAGTWYVDVDHDGYGSDGEFFPYTAPCGAAPKPGYVNNKDDCNDRDGTVNPKTKWYVDNDGDGIGTSTLPYVQSCAKPAGPYVRRGDDCNDSDNTVSPILAEVCEPEEQPQKDNNCNGNPNDTLAAITWFKDADHDGEGSPVILGRFCGKPADSSKITGDCDDTNGLRFHGNPEACEVHVSSPPNANDRYVYEPQIDNDCDGDFNNTSQTIWWYGDGDRDNYAGSVFRLRRCTDPSDLPGEVAGKYLPNPTPADCNDADANATFVRTWYPDTDHDGCGNPVGGISSC